MQTYSGSFDTIQLNFTPDPPLTEQEKYKHRANYPTTLTKIHVLLDGEDAAADVPSGYILFILNQLLNGLILLVQGQSVTAKWMSDPWQFDIRGDPVQNRATITLHLPEMYVAMNDVHVPLDMFGREVIRLSDRWGTYLENLYREEIENSEFNEQFLRFTRYRHAAQAALRQYNP